MRSILRNFNFPYLQRLISTMHHALPQFHVALADPIATQKGILHDILHRNATSPFGVAHRFANIRHYADFAAHIPIGNYDTHRAAIDAICQGESNPLTSEPITHIEETGGSTGGAKAIPYTASLLTAFQRAVLPWLADLRQHRPQAFVGKCYFIISPAGRAHTHTAGGIPIGTGNDLAYFGEKTGAWLAERTLFQPELLHAQSAAQWQWQSARLLLSAPELSFISLWSPTLLLTLLDTLQNHADSLIATISDATRRQRITQALAQNPIDTQALWPHLDTISTWTSHTAAAPAAQLQAHFPHVYLQGKGLLATEAVGSIPLIDLPHPILAINSHFYEFANKNDNIHLPHQLYPGERYRLILTTQGGLYRYDSGDSVHIHALRNGVPLMEFVGRDSLHSDLCGEKLTESFVQHAMQRLDPALPARALLQGIQSPTPHYCLYMENIHADPNIAVQLDQALCENPQYAHARRIGQLGALQLHIIPNLQTYAANYHRAEQRLATRKIPLLLPIIPAKSNP